MKKLLITLMSLVMMPAAGMMAQDVVISDTVISEHPGEMQRILQLDEKVINIVNTILNRYGDWKSVTFNGKIRSSKLPVSPSLRIYAERDSLIQLSLRAPILGEVGRVEITPREFLAVNKYNKTYCRETAENIMNIYPGLIGDIQSLLLGRMVVLGSGELSQQNLPLVDFSPSSDGEWVMVPKEQLADGKLRYGYVILPNGRTRTFYGEMSDTDNVQIEYGYQDGTMSMGVEVKAKGRSTTATLDFSSVKWGGNRMTPVSLVNGYRQTGIREFIKNVGR